MWLIENYYLYSKNRHQLTRVSICRRKNPHVVLVQVFLYFLYSDVHGIFKESNTKYNQVMVSVLSNLTILFLQQGHAKVIIFDKNRCSFSCGSDVYNKILSFFSNEMKFKQCLFLLISWNKYLKLKLILLIPHFFYFSWIIYFK